MWRISGDTGLPMQSSSEVHLGQPPPPPPSSSGSSTATESSCHAPPPRLGGPLRRRFAAGWGISPFQMAMSSVEQVRMKAQSGGGRPRPSVSAAGRQLKGLSVPKGAIKCRNNSDNISGPGASPAFSKAAHDLDMASSSHRLTKLSTLFNSVFWSSPYIISRCKVPSLRTSSKAGQYAFDKLLRNLPAAFSSLTKAFVTSQNALSSMVLSNLSSYSAWTISCTPAGETCCPLAMMSSNAAWTNVGTRSIS
mmetsp:Transcript_85402/g.239132  ORF Transcript_85402/g.239132 Transcript_85402/m.239132 type:complete len:250 (+) Transcript_85402:304-1053(+)